jgi:hypothetical protein
MVPRHEGIEVSTGPLIGVALQSGSQATGSTSFILQVCKSVAIAAHVRAPPSAPAKRLFFSVMRQSFSSRASSKRHTVDSS